MAESMTNLERYLRRSTGIHFMLRRDMIRSYVDRWDDGAPVEEYRSPAVLRYLECPDVLQAVDPEFSGRFCLDRGVGGSSARRRFPVGHRRSRFHRLFRLELADYAGKDLKGLFRLVGGAG